MEMNISALVVLGVVDLEAGRQALAAMDDDTLMRVGGEHDLLGWGWEVPGEAIPPYPWSEDAEVLAVSAGGAASDAVRARHTEALRASVAHGLANAKRLIDGENPWFESRIVTRIPLASGGTLLLCPENSSGMGDDCAYCDVVRLVVEILPDLGRAMGVFGISDVELTATFSS